MMTDMLYWGKYHCSSIPSVTVFICCHASLQSLSLSTYMHVCCGFLSFLLYYIIMLPCNIVMPLFSIAHPYPHTQCFIVMFQLSWNSVLQTMLDWNSQGSVYLCLPSAELKAYATTPTSPYSIVFNTKCQGDFHLIFFNCGNIHNIY